MCSSFILCDVMQSQFGLQLYNGLHISNVIHVSHAERYAYEPI